VFDGYLSLTYNPIEFEWDESKSEQNDRRRDLPFAIAIALFDGPVIEHVDDRRDYDEVRMKAVGDVDGLLLACVYTDRGKTRRIISLRRANRKERHAYRTAYSSGY
jgi:uncharacterized DUF497 family protein